MLKFFISTGFFCLYQITYTQVNFWSIPKQRMNLNAYAHLPEGSKITYSKFKISDQVSLKSYQEYLDDIKKDSSSDFHTSQRPHIEKQEQLTAAYSQSTHLEAEPVIGVSFEQAMNFALWYQRKYGNKGKTYRLPTLAEFFLADAHGHGELLGPNFLFANWTLNSFDESARHFRSNKKTFPYDYFYEHKREDHNIKKKKCVIGNSFLAQFKYPISAATFPYYAHNGYAHVSFRIVEVRCVKSKFAKSTNYQNDIKLK